MVVFIFVEFKGGICIGNNFIGLIYEVLDNYIVNFFVGFGFGYFEEVDSDDIGVGFIIVVVYSFVEVVIFVFYVIVIFV